MKTAGRESANRRDKNVQQPSKWYGRSKQILLIQGGAKKEKFRPGERFFSCLMSGAIVTGFYLWQRNFTA
jgi:hypothetical protein